MVWYQSPGNVPGGYATVAAGQTNAVLGNTGKQGDYLEYLTIIAGSTTPGVVVLKDGTTAVITTTIGTATVMPYQMTIPIRAYSKTGSWNVTTGAAVSVFATGQFS